MLPELGDPGARPPADAPAGPPRTAWIDARSGVAGDMLLGALLDAGAALPQVRRHVAAVLPDTVLLTVREVSRAGLRATKLDVRLRAQDQPHRRWADVRGLVEVAQLPEPVRVMALGAFRQLAHAEARVHGTPVTDVHFHEVGAWDSIADVVGVCAALHDLGVGRVLVGEPIALGSGTVATSHGELTVPVPAVLELARGFAVTSGGDGELATPTGLALLRALASNGAGAQLLVPDRIGVGAGSRDPADRANVVRVVLDAPADAQPDGPGAAHRPDQAVIPGSVAARAERTGVAAAPGGLPEPLPPTGSGSEYVEDEVVELQSNVDDLDPRVWPSVLEQLLALGALDAWLTPITMKKGRPAHVVSALVGAAEPARVAAVRDALFRLTPTFGVRARAAGRWTLHRDWVFVDVAGERVRVKVGYTGGSSLQIVQATPEFEDVADLATRWGLSIAELLDATDAAATAAGLVPGAPFVPEEHEA